MRCVVKLLAVLLCSQLLVGSQAKLQTTFSRRFTRCSPNNRIIPCVSPGDIKSKDADLYMNTALSKLNGVLIPLSRQLKPVAIRAYDYLPVAGTLNWLLVEVADPAGAPWLLEVELQDSLPDPYTPPADKVKLQNFRISKPAKA